MLTWWFGAALAATPVQTVERVDLDRYLGSWYEIASFPAWFQRGCTGTIATYSERDDGLIRVENRCFVDSLDGREKVAVGRARPADDGETSKLEVSFFGPFWGDYWILGLDRDYQWALVGDPDRDYLWILSRTPALPPETYAEIVGLAEAQGFDTARLQRTEQPADAPDFEVPGGVRRILVD